MQRSLSILEAPYEVALKRERGEDEDWNTRKAGIQNRINNLVKMFKIGDNGEKALPSLHSVPFWHTS